MNLAAGMRLAMYCAPAKVPKPSSRALIARVGARIRSSGYGCSPLPSRVSSASPAARSDTGSTCSAIACARARSRASAAWISAGGVASTCAKNASRARCSALHTSRSEPSRRSSLASCASDTGGALPAAAPGLWTIGTTSTSALTRSGWPIAACSADGAPAEAPSTAARGRPSASSTQTCASACASGEASAGRGVRR